MSHIMLKGKLATFMGIIFYVVLLVLFSMGEPRFDLVFIGTLPILFAIIFLFSIVNKSQIHPVVYWLIPSIFPLTFLLIWQSGVYTTISLMDGPILFAIHLIGIYLIYGFIYGICTREPVVQAHYTGQDQRQYEQQQQYAKAFAQSEAEKAHYQQLAQQYQQQSEEQMQKLEQLQAQISTRYQQMIDQYKHESEQYKRQIESLEQELVQKEQVTVEDVPKHLHTVEEKCKSLNAIIGYVFQDKNGGSEKIRSRLNIPRDFYNALTHEGSLPALEGIYEKLLLLELPEKALFSLRRTTLVRDQDGNDSMVEILANNHNDPVRQIFMETKDLCKRLIEFLRN
ncbi:MAG: hypothetical protein ACMXYF_05155 [Candidatus Woesearchaeota archaeon]